MGRKNQNNKGGMQNGKDSVGGGGVGRRHIQFPDDISEDLKDIYTEMDSTTQESLESTRRMKALCEKSKEAGINTLVKLDDQNEQFVRIGNALNRVNQDMMEAEEHLKGLDKWCGLCTPPCCKITDDPREEEMDKNMQDVAAMVGNLRNMAIDMGSEVIETNRLLDTNNSWALINSERVRAANQKTNRISTAS